MCYRAPVTWIRTVFLFWGPRAHRQCKQSWKAHWEWIKSEGLLSSVWETLFEALCSMQPSCGVMNAFYKYFSLTVRRSCYCRWVWNCPSQVIRIRPSMRDKYEKIHILGSWRTSIIRFNELLTADMTQDIQCASHYLHFHLVSNGQVWYTSGDNVLHHILLSLFRFIYFLNDNKVLLSSAPVSNYICRVQPNLKS